MYVLLHPNLFRQLAHWSKLAWASTSSSGGRGPSSPEGQPALSAARNLQRCEAPPQCRSERRSCRAKRGASGAHLWKAGLRVSADSEPRRG
eukprot:14189877-Alexandrium_andersonii.AAC.1